MGEHLTWIILMINDNCICRVCGFEYDDYIWGESGDLPSFDMCVCCGTTFGYQDFTIEAIRRRRKLWMKEGAKWIAPEFKPKDWSLEKALENIPEKFR